MRKLRKPPLAVTRAVAVLTLGLVLASVTTAHAQASQPTPADPPASSASHTPQFDIPAQSLSTALAEFARQSGSELLYTPDIVEGRTANAVAGALTREAAMAQLLQGTDLDFMVSPSGGITIGDRATLEAYRARLRSHDGGGGGIEEIIVTARQREESVQDIPISITALSAEDMKSYGVRSLADMEGIVPGLNMGGGGNGVKKDSNPFIRGVGQRETKVTLDPAVGTYLNGIFIGRTAGAMFDVAGLESVEVMRGPQGTLFGRNTTGGAISLTTKKPTNNWDASISGNIGNYNRSDVTVMLNAPIVPDHLLSRLTLASVNSDGYFTNINDNTKWGGDNRLSGMLQLRWLATDKLMFDLFGERTRVRETPRPQKCMVLRDIDQTGDESPGSSSYNPGYFAPAPIVSTNFFRATLGLPSYHQLCRESDALPNDKFASDMAVGDPLLPVARYWVDTSTVGLTGTWDIGDLGPLHKTQLKSITAWRRVGQIADEDLDAVGQPFVVRLQSTFTETTQWSQELKLSGSAFNDRLFFNTGLYYFGEETPEDNIHVLAGLSQRDFLPFGHPSTPEENAILSDIFGVEIPPDTQALYQTMLFEPASEILRTDNHAYAWYGQLDFDLTPELQLTAGMRYTQETRWSRYEKAYATPYSVMDGVLGAVSLPGMNNWTAYTEGYHPLLEWRYGLNEAGMGTVGDVKEGFYAGDELQVTNRAWTPMGSVKYTPNAELLDRLHLDSAMAYLSYSEGFHSGGVTAGAVDTDWIGDPGYPAADPIIFKPEKVKNYELGLKLQTLNRRVQTNLAVFYMDYTNMQLTSNGLRAGIPIPFIENAGKAVIKGVEAELVVMPLPAWRVMANASWTKADIKEWNAAQYNLVVTGDQQFVGDVTYIDRSDEPMPRVPEWQAFLSTDYSFLLWNGSTLITTVSARYMSEIYHGYDRGSYCFTVGGCELSKNPNISQLSEPLPGMKNALFSDPVIFLDARLTWLSADGSMEIAAWGKNLTDVDDYMVGGIPLVDATGGAGVVYANPRTFGLTMTYNFGAR